MKYIRTTRTVNPETTIVFCQGGMSTLAVEELHQAVDPLLEDTIRHLVLELREVRYVSSSVLQFLIEANTELKKKGGRTSLVGAGPLVRSVIETARLDSLFEFCDTLEELGIDPPAAPSSKPAPAPPASRSTPPREKATPPRVEKIFPKPPPKRDAAFWRFWGGLAALLAASMALSIYLYLTRY